MSGSLYLPDLLVVRGRNAPREVPLSPYGMSPWVGYSRHDRAVALKSLRFAIPTKLSTLEASKPLIEGVFNWKLRIKLPAVLQHRRCSTGSLPPRSANPLWSHSQGLYLKPSSEVLLSPAIPRRYIGGPGASRRRIVFSF